VTPYTVLLAGYLGLLTLVLVVEAAGRVRSGPFRPVATLLKAALAAPRGRWVVWAAWAWIGFHFLAR
jgi:hypothetical protein